MRRLVLALVCIFPMLAGAEPLKNRDFLKLSDGQKHWWYAGAYTLAGHIVLLEDEAKSQCVWNWFFEAPDKRKALLEKSFKKYPDHTPTSIVISLLRRDCEVFKK